MKKEYNAPIIEYMTFSAYDLIAAEKEEEISFPYNDGDLGWT